MHARPRWASASVRLDLARLRHLAAHSGLAGLTVLATAAACAPPGPVTAPMLPGGSPPSARADDAPPSAGALDPAGASPDASASAGPLLVSPRTIEASAPARFRVCTADADCVSVPRVGCCHNGWREAVATSQRDAYAASFTCPDAHPICAMFVVRDTRAATCDAPTHLCTMVTR